MDRNIRTVDHVLRLLDGLFAPEADRWTAGGAPWWDGFYADRAKSVPFFVAKPDEHLVSYLDRGLIAPGRALDLGRGPGRNALHLASQGFTVDVVDLSPTAIARRRRGAPRPEVPLRISVPERGPTPTHRPRHPRDRRSTAGRSGPRPSAARPRCRGRRRPG
nr:methyltransferase domain-containing protein [Streptomyces sp. PRh5]